MGQALAQHRQQRLEKLCETDVVFFINHLKTFDPRTKAKDIEFKLYPYQEEYARELAIKIRDGGDLLVEKSRDMGVSWVTLAVIYWCWKYTPGFQALLGSRKEDYVDNWTMKSLFPKIEYMISNDPFPIPGWDSKKNRLYMKLIHPTNGAVIEGESANANFSRAGRYNVIFFDELAFWPFAQSSWESAGDATPCRIAVTTPSDQPSYAKGLRNSGIIEIKTLHWQLHPLKDDGWYESEKLRRTSDEVARELDINWEGSITGIVYPEISHAQLGDYPYVPNWPLYVSWDFGLDGTALGWWQVNPLNGKKRRIDSFFKSDRPIHYFMPLFTGNVESGNNYSEEDIDAVGVLSGYKNAIHFGDPDVEKRSYQTKDMTSTREVLQSHGIYVQTNVLANDLESRKTETKRMLQDGIEINDTPRNRFFLECIKNSRYPKREETSQSTSANVKPIHDWTSHHRTEMEYFAVNYVKERREPAPYRTFRRSE
jgi:hypothetical protein